MLNIDAIRPSLNTHQAILYDRPLEARIFKPARQLSVECGLYRCELWVMPGAHAIRFDYDRVRAAELVTDQDSGLPEAGVLSAFLCSGERDYEHRFEGSDVEYLTTVQSECLSRNVYDALLEEARVDAGGRRYTLVHPWRAEAGECLSAIMVEPLAREVRIEAFHFLADGGVVLRTGSVFEHA